MLSLYLVQVGPYSRTCLSQADEAGAGPIDNDKDSQKSEIDPIKDLEAQRKLIQAIFGKQAKKQSTIKVLDFTKIFETKAVSAELQALGFDEGEIEEIVPNLVQPALSPKLLIQAVNQFLDSDEEIDPIDFWLETLDTDTENIENLIPISSWAYLPIIVHKLPKEECEVILGDLLDAELIPDLINMAVDDENDAPALQKLTLLNFYLAIKLFSKIKEDVSITEPLRKKILDYSSDLLSIKLSQLTSWDKTEESLVNLAAHLKRTATDSKLQELITNILKNHMAIRDHANSIKASTKYSDSMSWFETKQDLNIDEENLSTKAIAGSNSADELLQFQIQLRSLLDPVGDQVKKEVWDNPVDSVLNAIGNKSEAVFITRSLASDESEKVPFNFKPEDTNCIKITRDILAGFTTKGFKDFVFEFSSLVNDSKVEELLDSAEGEGYTKREQNFDKHRLTTLINNFFANTYTSFSTFLVDNGYFKKNKEISLGLAQVVSFIDDLKTFHKKTNFRIVNTQSDFNAVPRPSSKALYITPFLSGEIPWGNTNEDTFVIKHGVDPGHIEPINTINAKTSRRCEYFMDSAHHIQTKLAQVPSRGFGMYQTVASKIKAYPEIKLFLEEFLKNRDPRLQALQKTHSHLIPKNNLPDFILTTVNSDHNETDELVSQDVPETILV